MNDSISGAYVSYTDGKYYYNRSNGSDTPNTGWPSYHNGVGDDGRYYHFENEVPYANSRLAQAKSATNTLAYSLLSRNTQANPDLIRMALVTFSNTAQEINLSSTGTEYFTTDYDTFSDAVNDLSNPNGGTNWEYALQLANEMAVENDRATFVIFVTDGNPTFRQTRGVLNNGGTDSLGDNDVTDYYFAYNVYGVGNSDDHGRNYAAALAEAESIVNHNKNFYTIGISNDVTNLTNLTTGAGAGADHSKTATSNDELVAAFNEIAASIIAHLGYSDVKITDGITDLTQTVQKSDLVNFEEDDFTYSKERLATEEEIEDSTKIPEGAVIENRAGTRYVVWNNWDPTSEHCAGATYNEENGAVEWNMGESFMLEDGYTYHVRFKVWPSQEAYDLLADLNNGKKSYSSLTEAEKAQISEPTPESDGMYTLKTNSETSYTYREATKSGDTVTPVGEPSEPGSFPNVDPLQLTTKPLKVKKQWHNNYVDSRTLTDSIKMELYAIDLKGNLTQDDTFREINLERKYKIVDDHYVDKEGAALYFNTETNKNEYADGTEGTPAEAEDSWYDEKNYVSYGLVTYNTDTDSGEKIYETGHDFTLRETDDEAHYYELNAGVFRPMVINGTIRYANARYSTTYTNKTRTHQVIILKTSQDGTTPLKGAEFSLYTERGYNADPKQASKTGLTSGTDGKIDLGKLSYGKYYLVETVPPAGHLLLTEPVEITVDASGVTYRQGDSNLPQSGSGIIHAAETDPYTLIVTNNAGYELPSTGGPGTVPFMIFGMILIAGAGLLLWRRQRTI